MVKQMTSLPLAIPTVGLLALALSACGGGDPSTRNSGSEGSANANWAGEELTFATTSCRAIPGGERWTITASSARNSLQVRYWRDDADGGYDTSSATVTLELMDDDWRVLERYSAQDLTLDVSTENRASGEVELPPHHNPGVGEVRPEGGTLRFDMAC